MRTHALAAVAISTVLLAGGCSGSDPEAAASATTPAGAASASAPAAASAVAPDKAGAAQQPAGAAQQPAGAAQQKAEKPTDTALAEDTEAICAQASRTSTAFGKTVAEDLQLLTQAAAESKAAKAKAQEKVSRDVTSFSFALLDMSKLASDAKVKRALATMGARITALKGDISRVDAKMLTELHGTLDSACGRG